MQCHWKWMCFIGNVCVWHRSRALWEKLMRNARDSGRERERQWVIPLSSPPSPTLNTSQCGIIFVNNFVVCSSNAMRYLRHITPTTCWLLFLLSSMLLLMMMIIMTLTTMIVGLAKTYKIGSGYRHTDSSTATPTSISFIHCVAFSTTKTISFNKTPATKITASAMLEKRRTNEPKDVFFFVFVFVGTHAPWQLHGFSFIKMCVFDSEKKGKTV